MLSTKEKLTHLNICALGLIDGLLIGLIADWVRVLYERYYLQRCAGSRALKGGSFRRGGTRRRRFVGAWLASYAPPTSSGRL